MFSETRTESEQKPQRASDAVKPLPPTQEETEDQEEGYTDVAKATTEPDPDIITQLSDSGLGSGPSGKPRKFSISDEERRKVVQRISAQNLITKGTAESRSTSQACAILWCNMSESRVYTLIISGHCYCITVTACSVICDRIMNIVRSISLARNKLSYIYIPLIYMLGDITGLINNNNIIIKKNYIA